MIQELSIEHSKSANFHIAEKGRIQKQSYNEDSIFILKMKKKNGFLYLKSHVVMKKRLGNKAVLDK